MENLRFVQSGSTMFLGEVHSTEATKKLLGVDVSKITSSNFGDAFAYYLKQVALGKLITVDFGSGIALVVRDITEDERIEGERVKAIWDASEKRSKGWLVTKVFDEALGK